MDNIKTVKFTKVVEKKIIILKSQHGMYIVVVMDKINFPFVRHTSKCNFIVIELPQSKMLLVLDIKLILRYYFLN